MGATKETVIAVMSESRKMVGITAPEIAGRVNDELKGMLLLPVNFERNAAIILEKTRGKGIPMAEVAAQIVGLLDSGLVVASGQNTNQAISTAIESGQLPDAPEQELGVEGLFGGVSPKDVTYREWWTREKMEAEIQKRTPESIAIKAKDGSEITFSRRTQQVAGMPKDGGGELGGFVTLAYEPPQGAYGAKMTVKTPTGITGADGKPLYNESQVDMGKIDEVFMLDEETPDIEGRAQKLITATQAAVLRAGCPVRTVPVRQGSYSIGSANCISVEEDPLHPSRPAA